MIKSLILGVDGGTFSVINPLIEQGKLPNFQKLIVTGVSGNCISTIPPVTGTAWPSLLLGQNPGKHGVFGFFKKELSDYGQLSRGSDFITSEVLAGKTFLDYLSDKGKKVALITIPMTYPTWEINGIIVSGYPCPDNKENFVYKTKDINVVVPESLNFSADYYDSVNKDRLEKDEHEVIVKLKNLTIDLIQNNKIDCLMVVFGATDRMQHEYWRYRDEKLPATEEERKQFGSSVDRIYEKVDEAFGEILQHTDETTNVFVVSDHGGGAKPTTFFNVNTWLKERGDLFAKSSSNSFYRSLKSLAKNFPIVRQTQEKLLGTRLLGAKLSEARKVISASRFDWGKTKAYFYKMEFPSGGLVINLVGRHEQGIVTTDQYENYRDELIKDLKELKNNQGQAVFREIKKREEVYQGEHVKNAPDIIFIVNENFLSDEELRDRVFTSVSTAELSHISGLHRMEGMFIAKGPFFKRNLKKEINLIDLSAYVLQSCGFPIPNDMDGKIDSTILNSQETVTYTDREKLQKPKETLSAKEQEQIKKKLNRLGYL